MNNFFNKKNKEEFSKNGYVILRNVISKKKAATLKKKIIELYNLEKNIRSYNYKFDKHRFDKNNKRVWNLVNKSAEFRRLIKNKNVNKFMEWIFNRKTSHQKYFLSSFHANILAPGCSKQKLHIDSPLPEPLPDWPIKANSIWMLDDFTIQNGATEVVPKSHKLKFKPKKIIYLKTIKCIKCWKCYNNSWCCRHRSGENLSKEIE